MCFSQSVKDKPKEKRANVAQVNDKSSRTSRQLKTERLNEDNLDINIKG